VYDKALSHGLPMSFGVITVIKTINKIIIITGLACLSAILLSCKEKVTYTRYEQESQKYRFSEFINKTKTYPYEATKNKKDRVVVGYQRLLLGMNKEEVRKLAGEPDAEWKKYDTTRVDTYRGSSWGYYIHMHAAVYVNDKYDQYVHIYFDQQEKLYWANPHNIEGLTDKGSPRQEDIITIK
jgi:hypothetical protein